MRSIDFGRRYIRIKKPLNMRIDVRNLVVIAILFIAIIFISFYAIMSGTLQISFQDVFSALFGQATGMTRTVVMEWRLPRVLAAIIFGAGLAVSGAIFQSITANPLGSPDIIGFSSGSYTGALIMLLVSGSTSFVHIASGALAGGFITAILIYLLAFRKGTQGFRLIIVGIAISAMLGSVNSILLLQSESQVALTAAAWGVGSLNGIDWEQSGLAIILVLFLLIFAAVMNKPLRAMELGKDAAKSHGVQVEPALFVLMLLSVALTAVPTAILGPVAFVALAAPQIVKRFTKSANSLVPAAMMGAFLLLTADVVAQQIIPGIILPVGVITLSLGGIYLVWLLFRQARSAS